MGEDAENPEMNPEHIMVRECKKYMGIIAETAEMIYKEAKHQARQTGNRFVTPEGKELSPEVISAKFLWKT